MKKSTFIGNFVAWLVVAAGCIAFLAWYHLSDLDVVAAALGDSPLAQLGVVVASPLLLYAIGALLGLALVWLKKIAFGRGARLALRVVALVALAVIALCAVPVLVPDTGNALLGPVVVVVYVSIAAPILIMVFGFLYGLGCAGTDPSKRGPLAKYLPDDDDER